MPVVSLSLPKRMIKELDEVQESLGFAGRSELVRSAVRLLLQDVNARSALPDEVAAVLVVTHARENEEPVSRIRHQHVDIIKTHIHGQGLRKNCVELFLLEGLGPEVASMTNEFRKEDDMRTVKLATM